MILIKQVKIRPGYRESELIKKISSVLKVVPDDILSLKIDKLSVDARKKHEILLVLNIICDVKNESIILKRVHSDNIEKYVETLYSFNIKGTIKQSKRPVIVGEGPCGLFLAYMLSKNGYKPIVLERGYDVDTRTKDVESFWNGGTLNLNSNVLFGEGGAGTFSDGKLNTLVKDKDGRNKEVLKTFVKFGAGEDIVVDSKPHIGTDVLKQVVKNMREEIVSLGGDIKFNAQVTDILIDENKVTGVKINNISILECDDVFLCIGHSARDTFKMLYERNITMEQKDFAVGFRVEHRQKMIDDILYTDDPSVMKNLPHASYKLAYKAENNRGVYSFCMCPGGYVVNASSEPGRLCINGMSYSGRNGSNANSAIVVNVNKEDFGSEHPLAGIEFQRKIESKAFEIGNGAIPVQLYCDFKADLSDGVNLKDINVDLLNNYLPQTKGTYTMGKVSEILPRELSETFVAGMEYFDRIIPGFADDYTLISAIESRTSSPVRISRNESFESVNIKGLYPCGEGAGYAGGITSAAMDGIKAAEHYASKYCP